MTVRTRTLLLVVVVVLALGGAGGYGVWAFARYQDESRAAPGVPVASKAEPGSEIIFRNTASGQGRGMVATVPAAAPQGPRMLTDQACDRVYAAGDRRICLRTKLGIENSTEELVFTPDWQQLRSRTLAGLPSRTRLSADGRLASSTVFVSGHAYSGGFSTATEISATGGDSFGNLETFAVTVDGVTLTPQERNVWGVTFARDGDTFYATIGSADRNWLVRGSLRARTLTAI
ncbi:MAG: hypothetical protein HOQ07_06910, partial [Sinomonas sp.]|nr:hypothetical protein [Sinomonas sp.]